MLGFKRATAIGKQLHEKGQWTIQKLKSQQMKKKVNNTIKIMKEAKSITKLKEIKNAEDLPKTLSIQLIYVK